jgi:hypothetical protein
MVKGSAFCADNNVLLEFLLLISVACFIAFREQSSHMHSALKLVLFAVAQNHII